MEDKGYKNRLPRFSEYSGLSLEDQKWISENIPYEKNNNKVKKIVSVNRNGNSTNKKEIKTKLTSNKHEVISELKRCTYKTPPNKVAGLLEQLFQNKETKEGHWLYIAQHYPPRRINQVISKIIKEYQRGDRTIVKPAAYFTHLIKFRKKRKCFRNTNGISKQQNQ